MSNDRCPECAAWGNNHYSHCTEPTRKALALRTAEALEVAAGAVCLRCADGEPAPHRSAQGFLFCNAAPIRAAFAQKWPV